VSCKKYGHFLADKGNFGELSIPTDGSVALTAPKEIKSGIGELVFCLEVVEAVSVASGNYLSITYHTSAASDGTYAQHPINISFIDGKDAAEGEILYSCLFPQDIEGFVKIGVQTDDTNATGKFNIKLLIAGRGRTTEYP